MYRFIRSRQLRRGLVCGLSCLLILCVSLFSASPIKARVTLKVATEPAFPPFESQGKGGELEGFDIDLMKAIGQAADFEVEFQSLPFDGKLLCIKNAQQLGVGNREWGIGKES